MDVSSPNPRGPTADRHGIASDQNLGQLATSVPLPPATPVTLSDRAALGLLSVLVYIAAEAWLAFASPPAWLAIGFPVPAAVLAANALLPRPIVAHHGRPWLGTMGRKTVAVVIIGASGVIGFGALGQSPTIWDQPLTLTCAARDVLQGKVPYLTYEPQCERALHFKGAAATPIAQGAFSSYHEYPPASAVAQQMKLDEASGKHSGFPAFGYPPLASVLLLPVAYSSWAIINLWVCGLTLLALAVAYLSRPRPPLILFAWQLAGLAGLWYAFGWNPEEVAYLFLVVAFAQINRVAISAPALALATLSNPIAWVIAPVYVAIVAHRTKFPSRLRWLAATYAAVLIPWMSWDPALPRQLFTFVTLPEFPLGATVATLIPRTPGLHTLLLAALVVLIAACTGIALRYPTLAWALIPLAFLAFLVAWHAPAYYYLGTLWLPPAVLHGLSASSSSAGQSGRMADLLVKSPLRTFTFRDAMINPAARGMPRATPRRQSLHPSLQLCRWFRGRKTIARLRGFRAEQQRGRAGPTWGLTTHHGLTEPNSGTGGQQPPPPTLLLLSIRPGMQPPPLELR